MELITTLEQFMDKFGDKEASEFEEILESEYSWMSEDLNEKYYRFLFGNFYNLSEEEKLKFTIEQAEKIKNDRFIKDYFHYITIAEMKSDNENANEKLGKFAEKISKEDFRGYLCDFLINYFSNSDHNSIFSKFNFNFFKVEEIKFVIKYKNFFPFAVNDLLKQRYGDFECEDFLLEIEKNPCKIFDYLIKKILVNEYNCRNFLIYTYVNMQFAEQTSERFGKLSELEKNSVILDAKPKNITQEHVNLINNDNFKSLAQNILDSRNKQEHDIQNVQAKEIEGNKFNKFCEVIKLFFAGLVSSGSIASIIVGVIALAGLLTLSFSSWILVGVGVPVLIVGGIFFGKSIRNLRNLNSMANEPNVKEENADSSAISDENNKDENNISIPEFEEEEEDKSEIDLNK